MRLSRRSWLQGALWSVASAAALIPRRPRRVLVLGGTRFVGRHIVAAALARGHVVTLLHRGRTNPGLFPAAETLIGDREGDLSALRGRTWDVVVDTSGTRPLWVRRSCELLHASVARCIYVSSTAVYATDGSLRRVEEDPLLPARAEDARGYGARKAAAEREVTRWFAGRHLCVRPAHLCGPFDADDRFVRWPLRARRGGAQLVCGRPADRVAFTDARDLAGFVVGAIDRDLRGAFHVAGPPFTLAALVAAAQAVAGPTAPVWVDRAWLRAADVDFGRLPLGASRTWAMGSPRAVVRGLTFRPLAATMADTLAWFDANPRAVDELGVDEEAALLAAWRAAPEARVDERDAAGPPAPRG